MRTPKSQAKFDLKFTFPKKPGDEIPSLPLYLDELSDGSLMSLYSEMVSWVNYAKAEVSKAEIVEEQAMGALKHLEAATLIRQWDDKVNKSETVTMSKARRDVDSEVVDATDNHREARSYRKLVDTVFDRCERNANVISRELSRRISLSPVERRTQWAAP